MKTTQTVNQMKRIQANAHVISMVMTRMMKEAVWAKTRRTVQVYMLPTY